MSFSTCETTAQNHNLQPSTIKRNVSKIILENGDFMAEEIELKPLSTSSNLTGTYEP